MTKAAAWCGKARARILIAVYVSMSRVRVAPGRAQELVSAFRGRAHLADKAPGFLNLEVWQNDRDSGELMMVSTGQTVNASSRT